MTAAARADIAPALPTYADVEAAARVLAGVAIRTPVMTSTQADAATGAKLFFKCENFQRVGAFKFRGGYNAVSRLSADQKKRGVVAFSSGNHAQAIALAAKLLGVPAVIAMPLDAPELKIAATRGYGAEVVLFDRYTQNREELGNRLARERGLALLPPFDHADVIAGQGTAAKELFEEVGQLDALFVCLGGGGLLSGCALAARALSPGCRVIGVEPEAGDDIKRSLAAGHVITIPVPKTIADGAQTTAAGKITFPMIQHLVDEVVTVSDAQLVERMRFFAERMKMIVEPTGCLAAAAAFAAGDAVRGKRVGVVISGGNVDLATFSRLLA